MTKLLTLLILALAFKASSQVSPISIGNLIVTEANVANMGMVPVSWAPTNAYAYWTAGSITATNGELVTQWNDSSGNARHLYVRGGQSTNAPYFTNAVVNGLPATWWINSTTGTRGLTNYFGATPVSQPVTMVFVCLINNLNVRYPKLMDGIATAQRWIVGGGDSAAYPLQVASATGINSPTPNETIWKVLTVHFNNTGTYVRTNGVHWFSGTSGTTSSSGVTLGGQYDTTAGRSLFGGIAEAIIYKGSLATNDLQWVESNLRSKYGL